jgi:hypothetical protein
VLRDPSGEIAKYKAKAEKILNKARKLSKQVKNLKGSDLKALASSAWRNR